MYSFCIFVQFDRFVSIRIPSSKKDRPNLWHLKQLHSSTGDLPTSADVEGFIPRTLSEREILQLFEKMMVWVSVML